MLREHVDNDVQMTLKFFKPGEGLAQVDGGEYFPGIAGSLILEDGLSALQNIKLNENGIDEFLLRIFERAEAISKLAKKHSKGPGEKTLVTHFGLNKPKVLRESFMVLSGQD